MIRTIWIYIYATMLVIGSIFRLKKVKKFAPRAHEPIVQKEIFYAPRRVSQKVMEKTKTKVYVTGKENLPNGPALYVANHQGLFDILTLLGYLGRPIGFIAKKEIRNIPIIPRWMELLACVFIDRNDRRQSVKAIQQGIKNIKKGHSIVIFPEGTRSKSGDLLPFKPGSFRLGMKAKVPIIPIAIDGTREMYEENNNRVKPSVVHLSIGTPISLKEYENMNGKELAAYTETQVRRQLSEIRESEQALIS